MLTPTLKTLKSFAVTYDGEFKFYARSRSAGLP